MIQNKGYIFNRPAIFQNGPIIRAGILLEGLLLHKHSVQLQVSVLFPRKFQTQIIIMRVHIIHLITS